MNYDFNEKMDLIEAYIDGSLNKEQQQQAEKMLQENPELQEEYEYMKLAVSSVQLAALHAQVKNIAKTYASENEQTTPLKPVAKVYSIRYYALRVAAVLLITCASYIALMYATTTPDQLFSEGYISYELPTSRGISKTTTVEQAYRLGNWKETMNAASSQQLPTQKELFLAGMASLQLNKADYAEGFFKKAIAINNSGNDKAYQDESEFYLALTYVKLKDGKKAETILRNIRSKPEHTYYAQAKKISVLKTTLLNWK